jgi:hypothetical protein
MLSDEHGDLMFWLLPFIKPSGKPKERYEVRSEDNAVDMQIHD